MAQEMITFTRQNFIDYVFQPYNTAVKQGEYAKIDYNMWKEIRSWAYDDKYGGWFIRICRDSDFWTIYPYHYLHCGPEGYALNDCNRSFGTWLTDNALNIRFWDQDIQSALEQNKFTYDADICSNSIAFGDDGFVPNTIHLKSSDIYIDGKPMYEYMFGSTQKEEKENNNMKFGNFDFGPVDSSVRMSMYGMAIKNSAGTYVAYDKNAKSVIDVDIFNFEGANKFVYKIPVALKDVAVGDVVIHNRLPMFVQKILDSGRIEALDIFHGEEKTIVPTRSMFNFDFITKVVSFVDFAGGANADAPFGNMLPLLLMSDSGSKDMLPLMFLMNQGGAQMNPLMMYALMGDHKNNDMLPLLMMSGAFAPKCECKCGGKN